MIRNKRLAWIMGKAYAMNLSGGYYLLDGYNQKVLTDGVSFTITTRALLDNNRWLIEVDERD